MIKYLFIYKWSKECVLSKKPEFSKTPAIFDGRQEYMYKYIDQTKSKIGRHWFICNGFQMDCVCAVVAIAVVEIRVGIKKKKKKRATVCFAI